MAVVRVVIVMVWPMNVVMVGAVGNGDGAGIIVADGIGGLDGDGHFMMILVSMVVMMVMPITTAGVRQ
eukprot:10057455-Lingulodinium_polyedra.AAC.1